MTLLLDDRDKKEIGFARTYKDNFNHGTAGHNQYLLIAKLADEVDSLKAFQEQSSNLYEQQIAALKSDLQKERESEPAQG